MSCPYVRDHYSQKESPIQIIRIPILGIIDDVLPDSHQFISITNQPVVEFALPSKVWVVIFARPARDGGLELADDDSQGTWWKGAKMIGPGVHTAIHM